MRQLSLLYTANQQCYSVRYSPFDSSLMACVSCDKFGLSGSASLNIVQYQESPFFNSKFTIAESFRSNISLFDVEWSPIDPNLLLTANGDGSISVWKWPLERNNFTKKPIYSQQQHKKEVYSIQWEPSGMRSYHLLSASWDQTVKVWNLSPTGLTLLSNLAGHSSIVYSGSWNPKMTGILLSTSADKTFRLWDINSSSIKPTEIFTSEPTRSDILCCDWNKFDPNQFLLGYASGLIELRDFRNLKGPVSKSFELAHDYAIRKVKFSPHFSNLFGTVSYDMTTKLWTTTHGLMDASQNHTEFAYGFDFDPKIVNRFIDCGWDRKIMLSEFDITNKLL